MKRVADLSHLEVLYMTGNSTSADAMASKLHETLESFRSGKVNLLFATDVVVEEGIDVPNCSTVICYDIPKMVCSNVQSWGRARQSVSQFNNAGEGECKITRTCL